MILSASTNQAWTKNIFSRNGLWFGYWEQDTRSVSYVPILLKKNYLTEPIGIDAGPANAGNGAENYTM